MKTIFVNGDPLQGILGTIVTAEFLNAVNNHRHTGRDLDGDGALDYAADTGNGNTYVIALSPALDTYIIGMPITFKATHANTGSATLNVNALGAKTIKKRGTSNLESGDIVSGQIVTVVYDGAYFQMISVSALIPPTGGNVGDVRFSLSLTPNSNELVMNGGLVSRTTYAALWQWASNGGLVQTEANWSAGYSGLFSSGDGATTFRLPDFRGVYPRFLDSSRGLDPGRNHGWYLPDELKSHYHTEMYPYNSGYTATPGVYGNPQIFYASTTNTGAAGGTETRVKSITLAAFIRYI